MPVIPRKVQKTPRLPFGKRGVIIYFMLYPDNIASQKAFENAGFKLSHTHKDQDGESMLYVYDGGVND